MKDNSFRFIIPAALAVAALFLSASPISAKSEPGGGRAAASASPQAQQWSGDPQASKNSQNQPQAYEGTIVVLPSGAVELKVGGRNYKLSNQSKAAKFANKKVIVTGTYNAQSGTIQVLQIKPA